jgi:Fe-S-cluster containining protein
MSPDFFSWPEIQNLLARPFPQQQALQDLYARLPATRCRRRARCCALLPEMSWLEALAALDTLRRFSPDRRKHLLGKVLRYFLTNPLEISTCPFLEGAECLIYENRFFGCRAYGLWSPEEYRRRAEANQRAKRNLGEQWLRLGVRLPGAVLDFQVPYCRSLELTSGPSVDDRGLVALEAELENLIDPRDPGAGRFRDLYFSDLSFLLAGLRWGVPQALRLKFTVVRDGLRGGTPPGRDQAWRGLEREDPFV